MISRSDSGVKDRTSCGKKGTKIRTKGFKNMQQSALLLSRQLKDLNKHPVEGFSAGLTNDNIYEWDILIIGPENTPYEGGFFKAKLYFPTDYPINPPKMKFTSEIWHPNVIIVIYPRFFQMGKCVFLFYILLDQVF